MPVSVRHLHTVEENLNHRHAELIQAVDKARIICDEAAGGNEYRCPLGTSCRFHLEHIPTIGCICGLEEIEGILKKEKE